MKTIIGGLLGLTGTAVFLAACAPIAPLSANHGPDPGADHARTSAQRAQQVEMAAMQLPAYAQAVAAEAEAAQAPRDPGGLIRSMVQITDADRTGMKAGMVPASVLSYDAQLIRMVVKTPATLKEHQRDRAWTKRKHDLFVARDAALQAHTAAVVQKNRQEAQMYNNTAQLYGGLSEQQRKQEANRADARQDYMNRLGAVAAPSCVPVSGQGWQGCAPR